MTLTELEDAIKGLLPQACTGFDNEGQLIIFTNLMPLEDDEDSELVEFKTYADSDNFDDEEESAESGEYLDHDEG